MTSQTENKRIREIEDMEKQAGDSLGDFLRFIDQLPDPPERIEIPFPYGTTEPRPYGWHSECTLGSLDRIDLSRVGRKGG